MTIIFVAAMCMECMVALMSKVSDSPRRRNISWSSEVDRLAEEMAFDKHLKGGVSELLERLVRAESKRKRGIAHLHPRELEGAAK